MSVCRSVLRKLFYALPHWAKAPLLAARGKLAGLRRGTVNSRNNIRAFNDLMRHGAGCGDGCAAMLAVLGDELLPHVDISAVTCNSLEWLAPFGTTLARLNYPPGKLHIRFVDSGSAGGTLDGLRALVARLGEAGMDARLIERPHAGPGGGRNAGIAAGDSEFVLVADVDLTFEPDALRRIVSHALRDTRDAVAWELREKPREHPKVYEPLSGTTNWNSHASVLLRRSAVEAAGGYSGELCGYGEDVELSYRLRARGHVLRYNPHAAVWRRPDAGAGELELARYVGSTFANLYLRLRYGGPGDIAMVAPLALALLVRPPRFPGARRRHAASIGRLLRKAPKALAQNMSTRRQARFPFHGFDYDVARRGALHEAAALPGDAPRVSVITRSYEGREALLRQAMACVANQTYPNVEHIIAEDRGTSLAPVIEDFARRSGHAVVHVTGNRLGRSDAGNLALERATGEYCVFLDDDDQFYGDHIETLVAAVLADAGARGAFSLAFDLPSQRLPGADAEFKVGLPVSHAFMEAPLDPRVMIVRNPFPIQAVLFERSLYAERGGFDEDLDALEDWALWQKYTHRTHFAFVPKTTSFYRTPLKPAEGARRAEQLNAAYETVRRRMDAWRAAWDERAGPG